MNADGFSDQPQIKSISLHPRLFFYDHQSKKLAIGYSGMLEEKTGGDMKAIESAGDSLHSFFEKDKTFRNTIDFNFQSLNQKKDVITFKGAASLFSRTIGTKKSSTYFEGIDWSFFTELSYLKKIKQHTLVTGINFVSDFFNTAASSYLMLDKIRHFTGGLFIQDEWRFNDRFSTEVGLRFDHQQYNLYGEENFILPRISIIYGWSKHLTSRIGCGFGYKAADVFSNDDFIESGLLPQNIRAEKSFGSNGDLNYSTIIEQVSLVVNQSFFYTNIKNPIVESTAYSSAGFKENSSGYMDTKGSESYIRINYRDIDLYLGYVFSLPQLHQQGSVTDLPLTPENKFASTCVFEMENGWKAGIEASYIGQQHLYTFQNVDKKSPAYWIGALLLQKKISSLTMTLNCENIFDFRQSKIEEVVIPPFSSPTFKPVWAPLEGRVFNLSLKLLI